MSKHVFISHSSRDKELANTICSALESKNIHCWIAPRDVVAGAMYGEALINAINESRILLLILSSDSNESPQVIREVERAGSKGIPIICFRIEEVILSKSLEFFISTHHWLDAITPPLESHIEKLGITIDTFLKQNTGMSPKELKPEQVYKIKDKYEKISGTTDTILTPCILNRAHNQPSTRPTLYLFEKETIEGEKTLSFQADGDGILSIGFECALGKTAEDTTGGFVEVDGNRIYTGKDMRRVSSSQVNFAINPGVHLITIGFDCRIYVAYVKIFGLTGVKGLKIVEAEKLLDKKENKEMLEKQPMRTPKEKQYSKAETFSCKRSHAGGMRYISCEMTLSDSGIRWKFLESFKREEFISWDELESWECYGATYGYSIDLKTKDVKGTRIIKGESSSFKFSWDDLTKVVEILDTYASKKKRSSGDCR